jgi:peptidoglycan/LPS O-acetylase OafA/YrhL
LRAIAFQRTGKIYPLTSVRFFGALVVVFHHTVQFFLPGLSDRMLGETPRSFLSSLLLFMPVSVSFFFLLSGYVLSVVYLQEGKPVERRKFYAARFARIYPLYFVTLVLDTPHVLFDRIHRYGLVIGAVKTTGIFLGYVAMLRAWNPILLRGIDDPNWSLSAELFFYLCFPVLGFLLWKLRGAWIWVAAMCLYVAGQLLVVTVRPSPPVWLDLPLLHLSTFALGVLLARWQSLRRERGERVAAWQCYSVLALAGAGILLSAAAPARLFSDGLFFTGLLAPIFAGVIWALSSTTTVVSRLLCAGWLVALGNASFALYLIHAPVLHLFEYFHWQSSGAYAVYLAVCIGLSLLSFYSFEMPVRLWLLKRFHSRSLETTAEASIAQ